MDFKIILIQYIYLFYRPIPQIVSKIPESETTVMNLNTSERPENDKVLKTHNDDDQRRKPMFLFSVDYILNKAGETNAEDDTEQQNKQHFDWLYCTRFKPPKLDSE